MPSENGRPASVGQQWFRLRSIFEDIKDLPADLQEAYIARHAATEPALARQVLRLIEAHRAPATLLDRPLPERVFVLQTANVPAESAAEDLTGAVLRDRYTVHHLLRQGGSSRVYLAADAQFGDRDVVIKQILPLPPGAGLSLPLFEAETAALSRLNHPGIPRPLDSGLTPGGAPFLVLEFVPGPTLREVMDAGPVPLRRALRLLQQIASAVTAAHAAGVVHLDLKPGNIVVRPVPGLGEHAVLLDFGLAQRTGAEDARNLGGSLNYMAPEQASGHQTPAADQFALARIASELIPARGAAREVIGRALSPAPALRYPSVEEFVRALTSALQRPARWPLWALLAVALFAAAVLLAVAFFPA